MEAKRKRSVDISAPPKKGKVEVVVEGDGRLEKIEDGDAPSKTTANGTGPHAYKETASKDDSLVNGAAESPASPETDKSIEEGATPDKDKKKKKEKSKMKWSFRFLSFSKKDKSKPNVSKNEAMNGHIAKEDTVAEVDIPVPEPVVEAKIETKVEELPPPLPASPPPTEAPPPTPVAPTPAPEHAIPDGTLHVEADTQETEVLALACLDRIPSIGSPDPTLVLPSAADEQCRLKLTPNILRKLAAEGKMPKPNCSNNIKWRIKNPDGTFFRIRVQKLKRLLRDAEVVLPSATDEQCRLKLTPNILRKLAAEGKLPKPNCSDNLKWRIKNPDGTFFRIRTKKLKRMMRDAEVEVLPNFSGRALTAALPKLPRPEVGTVPTDKVFGVQKIFHPVLNKPRDPESLERVVQRIQRYAFTEGVRIGQMFRDFDATDCGRLTEANFRRCLDMMGVGKAGTRRYNLDLPGDGRPRGRLPGPNRPLALSLAGVRRRYRGWSTLSLSASPSHVG